MMRSIGLRRGGRLVLVVRRVRGEGIRRKMTGVAERLGWKSGILHRNASQRGIASLVFPAGTGVTDGDGLHLPAAKIHLMLSCCKGGEALRGLRTSRVSEGMCWTSLLAEIKTLTIFWDIYFYLI